MSQVNNYTLSDVVNQYMAMRNISIKKYYAGFLLNARYAWKELFKNTIYSVQSEWKTLQAGEPYNYVDVPQGTVRLFSVSELDHCGNIVPLFYNSELNIVSKPIKRDCGCTDCDCSLAICGAEETLTKTTKLLFTIEGIDYYETTWVKFCKNGDIIEYKTIPTKNYNSFAGGGGDFNDDYNNDYLIAHPPFEDYTITTETTQKILCKLDIKPCGCPKDTEENQQLITSCCGSFLAVSKYKHCEPIIGDVNDNGRGHVKMSECGNKIYYKPSPRRHEFYGTDKLPTHLLINYQTSGESCGTSVVVPDYALESMFFGIDHYTKRFNMAFTKSERDEAKYAFIDSQNKIIMFLNPLSIEMLKNVQDSPQKW
jgi:hypothetical protein